MSVSRNLLNADVSKVCDEVSRPRSLRHSLGRVVRRSDYRLGLWILAFGILGLRWDTASYAAEAGDTRRYEFSEVHMGSEIRIVLYSADSATANRAARGAYRRIAALNKVLSDYDPESELSLLSKTAGTGQKVALSDDLWIVLARAQALAQASDGAFDVTVGPLVKAWRSARRSHTFPPADRLAKARAAVGYRNLKLDPRGKTAELLIPGMLLDLGGIAMGYTLDETEKLLRREGITSALIDASGDILCSDPPPGRDGWRVGIAPLTESKGPASRYVLLKNEALTTSGDAFQYVELAGRRYSHIVDPKSGLGLTTRSSVTVIAPDGMTADSLATAISVLGDEAGLKLLEAAPGASALVVIAHDGGVKARATKDFPPDAR